MNKKCTKCGVSDNTCKGISPNLPEPICNDCFEKQRKSGLFIPVSCANCGGPVKCEPSPLGRGAILVHQHSFDECEKYLNQKYRQDDSDSKRGFEFL